MGGGDYANNHLLPRRLPPLVTGSLAPADSKLLEREQLGDVGRDRVSGHTHELGAASQRRAFALKRQRDSRDRRVVEQDRGGRRAETRTVMLAVANKHATIGLCGEELGVQGNFVVRRESCLGVEL